MDIEYWAPFEMDRIYTREVYTREVLQGLKKEHEDLVDKRSSEKLATDLREAVIIAAAQGKTNCFTKQNCPEIPDDRQYKIFTSAIDILKTIFPDVTIKYDDQTCVKTGRKINQRIYVDWS